MASQKPPKSAGTYGLLDLLRSPRKFLHALGLFGRAVPDRPNEDDLRAVRAGAGRRVSCFMWSELTSFPQRFTRGYLDLRPTDASWAPAGGSAIAIPTTLKSLETRPVESGRRDGEALLKKSLFAVVTCRSEDGLVEFAVPKVDAPMVFAYFAS